MPRTPSDDLREAEHVSVCFIAAATREAYIERISVQPPVEKRTGPMQRLERTIARV